MIRHPLNWDMTAAEVLRLVRADPHPVALFGAWAGGSDIIAACPTRTSSQLAALDLTERAGASHFGGGWIGYIGYDPQACWFGYYEHVLRRDRATGTWWFESLGDPGEAKERLAELSARKQEPHDFSCGLFRPAPSPAEHKAAVRQTIDYIRRGDLFQANICLRLEAGFDGDPLDAFCQAATELDPPYAAFLRLPAGAVASLSPELFLRRAGSTVLTRPIKGTAKRPGDPVLAKRARAALVRSGKDRAENMMIVDLMRNDLGRVCLPGSVTAPGLVRAEPHPGVWHLVSEVRGTLRPDAGDVELIRAAFPPGSVTGAPKVRALEVIGELEATPRQVYTGAIGYRSPAAGLELNVAIRTFEFAGGRVWLGAGGGITARSVPAAEYRECLDKAAPLIRAIGGKLTESPVPVPARPKAALGVFTSLRVTEGRCHDLDGHLARLEESTVRLYGKQLPPQVYADLAACLTARPTGRLRVTARPFGGILEVTANVTPVSHTATTARLYPRTIAGGVGADKWLDRRILAAGLGPDEHLLITDADGDVLETDRANVFAVVDGVLRTPPADGRLLPGITRAAVLRLADVAVKGFTVDELVGASEIFVTNSVHGVVPVTSLEKASWTRAGPVTEKLRAAIAARPASVLPSSVLPAARQHQPRRLPPRSARPAIVLIDNHDSFTYNLAHLLLSTGCGVEVVRNDEVAVADIAAFDPDGVLISPGPGTPADAGISVAAVRACGPATPVLGVCLGHQAIAAAFGGQVAATEPVHGRASAIGHDGQGLLAGLPRPFTAARYHSLVVAEPSLPAELRVTARGPGGIVMGLRHGTRPVEGVQFHPESILTPHGEVIIRNFLAQAKDAGSMAHRRR